MIERKVKLNEINKERGYPWIGISGDGEVVLFVDHGCGTVLEGDEYGLGYYNDGWDMDSFTHFSGEIALSQD